MTADALLALLLNVAIPAMLAVMGGILAVRSLDSDRHKERSLWVVGFIFMALLAIALGFVQQIRLTEEQSKTEQLSKSKEQALEANQRYTQGQLDSIDKVLSTVAASPETGPTQMALLHGLLDVTSGRSVPQASKASTPEGMSDGEIETKSLLLAGQISAVNAKFNDAILQAQSGTNAGEEYRNAKKDFLDQWGKLRGDYMVLRNELLRRVPNQNEVLSRDEEQMRMIDSSLISQDPLAIFAYHLENLSSKLESKKKK